jgi:hypothetical protein
MLSDEEILKRAHDGIQENLLVTAWWRSNEIRDNYGLYEGSQWLEEESSRQIANNQPIRTMNRVQPVVDAITGFEIQNRSTAKFIPRVPEQMEQGVSDLVNDGIKWLEQTGDYGMMKSLAVSDMLICGMGFLEHKIEYTENPNGKDKQERVFPYFMLWDVTTRDKNFAGADWICRAKIIDRNKLHQYLKGMTADERDNASADFGSAVDARFLDFFDTIMIVKSLGVIYHYQWRELEYFYRVENPLQGYEGDPDDPDTQAIVMAAEVLQEKYKFNVYTDKIFAVPLDEFSTVKDLFKSLGFEKVKSTKSKKYRYFRADLVGNRVISKSENFSQNGFSIQVMTGKYDEIRQCYYGIMRSMKEAQRLLNQTVSDYEGFLRNIPKGGFILEVDAVPNMEGFRDTLLKANMLTVVSPGALAAGKIMPKPTPPIPQGLLDMIQYADQMIMQVVGVTGDFMGQADSKLMTAQLNAQLVRQGLMVLAPYFDSIRLFTKQSGQLFYDAFRILLDNCESKLIGHITNASNEQFVQYIRDNEQIEYDIVIDDVPMTPDERQATFEKLLQLSSIMLNKPNPVDITPIVMEYAPFKGDELETIKQLMQPPEPQQPDPVQQRLIEAESMYKEASAKKQDAEALKTQIEAMLKQHELKYADQSVQVEMFKKESQGEKDQVTALKGINEIRNYKENRRSAS